LETSFATEAILPAGGLIRKGTPAFFPGRLSLAAENMALRLQLAVYSRK
jgi:hypothetical protein